MTRRTQCKKNRKLSIEQLSHRIMLDAAGFVEPVFYGPTPYLSELDTPDDFVPEPDCPDCISGIETFEDGSLDLGIVLSEGEIIGPDFQTGLDRLTDSVDGDDGIIDGTGQTNEGGYSYFTFENSITVTLPSLMQSAGLVWTDGGTALTNVVFEAFDQDGNSLGVINAGDIADNSFMGTTAEDSFFGVSFGDGVTTGVMSMTITNVGGEGIEIDHIQFANCSECCDIDLELTKTVDARVVQGDEIVTWRIEVTNNSDTATTAAMGVQIGDVLPAGVTLVGNFISEGTFDIDTVTWSLVDPLDPGEVEFMTLRTKVDADLANGTVLKNTAQVIAADQEDVDSTPNNDTGDQSEDDEDYAEVIVENPELLMLSGFSYVDTNNDGIFQPYELPLLGVEIQLMGTDGLGNAGNLSTFTDVNGFYKFNDLAPGTYMVTQTQPPQFVDGKDTVGNLGGENPENDKLTVELTENGVEYNFGELGLRPEFVNKRLYLTSTPYTSWEHIDVRQSSVWYSFDVPHRTFLEIMAITDGAAVASIFNKDMELVAIRDGESFDDPIIIMDGGQYYLQVSGDTVIDFLSLNLTTPGVSVDGDTVIAVATAGDDNVELELGGDAHILSISGMQYFFDAAEVDTFHIGASDGYDTVTIHGTELDDTADAIATSGHLYSSQYSVNTYSFDETNFIGGGGDDYTQVYGSLDDDSLSALPGDVKLVTPDNVLHMLDFSRVDAYGRGGYDYASLYGSQSDDLFVATDSHTYMSGGGSHSYTKGFERVDGFGRGGNDEAMLFDSAGNDIFFSSPAYSVLATASRISYAKGFEQVHAIASNGGSDMAKMVGLLTGDSFQANANIAWLMRVDRDDKAEGFDEVTVEALDAGETPFGAISATDYVLTQNVNWL